MKNIKSLILISIIGILSFAEFAFGQDRARQEAYRESAHLAISPYAQSVPNDSYTFIGISHPSLPTAAARIGVAVEVVGMQGTVNTQPGRSAVFTVNGGETHRVFIVNQSHSSINTSNAAFTDARTHIIPTVDTPQFGSIMVTTVHEAPNILAIETVGESSTVASNGDALTCATQANMSSTPGCGFSNLNQLSMWGIVYSEAAGTGFAMEFIGDMQDSIISGPLGCRGSLKLGSRGGDSFGNGCGSTVPGSKVGGVDDNEPPNSLTNSRPGAGIN